MTGGCSGCWASLVPVEHKLLTHFGEQEREGHGATTVVVRWKYRLFAVVVKPTLERFGVQLLGVLADGAGATVTETSLLWVLKVTGPSGRGASTTLVVPLNVNPLVISKLKGFGLDGPDNFEGEVFAAPVLADAAALPMATGRFAGRIRGTGGKGSCAESARLNSAWNEVPRSIFSYGFLRPSDATAASRSWHICRTTSQPILAASSEEMGALRRASSV